VVAKLRFRRAMLHAIDYKQMVESLVGDLSTVAHTFVEPGTAEYSTVAEIAVRYGVDPLRELQLLEWDVR
jgi:ABC-type oligopeptide transport system substrate-binding subunit